MTFTDTVWDRIAPIRAGIDALPFVTSLTDGSLDPQTFTYYMTQDALYLAEYARALAAAASQSPTTDEVVFWAEQARSCIVVERELHAARVTDLTVGEMSPTCTAYTSYLLRLAAGGSYPVLAAGLLPCFWIYEDVGNRITADAGDLDGHPYADWIATYADPEFAEATRGAKAVVDRAAQSAGDVTRQRMEDAFVQAARFEWMFWDAAARRETWPVGPAA